MIIYILIDVLYIILLCVRKQQFLLKSFFYHYPAINIIILYHPPCMSHGVVFHGYYVYLVIVDLLLYYLCIERFPGNGDIFRTSVRIKVLAACANSDISGVVSLETAHKVLHQFAAQVRILTIGFLWQMKAQYHINDNCSENGA